MLASLLGRPRHGKEASRGGASRVTRVSAAGMPLCLPLFLSPTETQKYRLVTETDSREEADQEAASPLRGAPSACGCSAAATSLPPVRGKYPLRLAKIYRRWSCSGAHRTAKRAEQIRVRRAS